MELPTTKQPSKHFLGQDFSVTVTLLSSQKLSRSGEREASKCGALYAELCSLQVGHRVTAVSLPTIPAMPSASHSSAFGRVGGEGWWLEYTAFVLGPPLIVPTIPAHRSIVPSPSLSFLQEQGTATPCLVCSLPALQRAMLALEWPQPRSRCCGLPLNLQGWNSLQRSQAYTSGKVV